MWRHSASLGDYAIYSRPTSIVLLLYCGLNNYKTDNDFVISSNFQSFSADSFFCVLMM